MLDLNFCNSEKITSFKGSILKFICPFKNSVFLVFCDLKVTQLPTRLILGLSQLQEYKFKHNFQDCLNPINSCGEYNETSSHYLLHCSLYTNERIALLNVI